MLVINNLPFGQDGGMIWALKMYPFCYYISHKMNNLLRNLSNLNR